MSADLLALLMRATLALSGAILIVLVLRAPLRRAFGAQIAYTFWLLAPMAALASLLPARRIFVDTPQAPQALEAAPAIVPPEPTTGNAALAFDPVATAVSFDLPPFVLALWLSGVAVSIALVAIAHARFTARLRLRAGEGLHVAERSDAGSAVIGLLRPRIVVPADFDARYNELERRLVLAHERAHISAGDVQANAFAALMQCLFWFNPLAHFARAAFRIDQELACDERVMQRHGNARRAYAEAMLKTQLAARAIPLGCAWPPAGLQPLKQRIAMLARPHPRADRRALGAALCGAVVLASAIAIWAAQPPQLAHASERSPRQGGALLVEALMAGDVDAARTLVDNGADVDHWSPGDGTPLIIAARLDDPRAVQFLLDAGADVNKPAPGDGNPLIVASNRGAMTYVRAFVEAGADVNAIVHGDETPLINAARNGHIEAARYLIADGADVNLAVIAPTVDGRERRSPLSMAVRGGHAELAQMLRDAGARD